MCDSFPNCGPSTFAPSTPILFPVQTTRQANHMHIHTHNQITTRTRKVQCTHVRKVAQLWTQCLRALLAEVIACHESHPN